MCDLFRSVAAGINSGEWVRGERNPHRCRHIHSDSDGDRLWNSAAKREWNGIDYDCACTSHTGPFFAAICHCGYALHRDDRRKRWDWALFLQHIFRNASVRSYARLGLHHIRNTDDSRNGGTDGERQRFRFSDRFHIGLDHLTGAARSAGGQCGDLAGRDRWYAIQCNHPGKRRNLALHMQHRIGHVPGGSKPGHKLHG